MKGKARFTTEEAKQIRELLRKKTGAASDEQKKLRGQMRKIGFYISDFTDSVDGFLDQDFDALVQRGSIKVQNDADD